ncbi:MAG: hypothetical protein WCP21_08055, partial [Armatimonadota bacterium]
MPALLHPLPKAATPLAVARALQSQPGFVWLDSSRPGGDYGQHSFIACNPFLTLTAKGRQITLAGVRDETFTGDPFAVLDSLLTE